VLREEIVMYSDHNESTRRFSNPRRIEDFWVQQGKVLHGKEVVAICVAASMLWLVGLARGKNYFMLQVLLIMLLHKEGSNKELKCWL
jgi:hypothetical protein